jgi:FkbM family methyltransferase
LTASNELRFLRRSNLDLVSKLKYLLLRLSVTERLQSLSRTRDIALSLSIRRGSKVWLRLGTTDVLVFRELFLAKEYDEPLDELKIDKPELVRHVVDLGANIGLASRLLFERFPNASFTCVEPESGNFKTLVRNLASVPDANLLKAAVSTHNGSANLEVKPFDEWGCRISEDRAAPANSFSVELKAITDILKQSVREPKCLLKIDVEGLERELFKTAKIWADAVDFILLEIHLPYTDVELENDLKEIPAWQISFRADCLFALRRA